LKIDDSRLVPRVRQRENLQADVLAVLQSS